MNAVSPWCDPVVAEVHAIREDLACAYEGDLLAYSDVAVAYGSRLNLHPASIVEVKTADVKAQAQAEQAQAEHWTTQNVRLLAARL